MPVSGLIIAPAGKAPRGGRNVLAWAHGTTGLTKECVVIGAIMTSQHSKGWVIGLVVAIVSGLIALFFQNRP